MKIKNRALRATAVLISYALIHASFSPAAWAQIVPRVGDMNAPVGSGSSSAGSATSGNSAAAPAPALSLQASALISPVAGLGVAPAGLPASAIAAAAPFAPAPAAALRRAAAPSARVSPAAAAPSAAAAALTPSALPAASTPERGAAPAKTGAPEAGPSAEPAAIVGGERTGGVAARVSRRFNELKSFFSGRRDAGALPAATPAAAMDGVDQNESVRPNGLIPASAASENGKVSSSGGDNAPPAPPAKNDDGSGKKKAGGLLGLGAAVTTLIGGLLIMQVGAEAQGSAMAQLTEKAFGDFSILAQVTIFSQIGSMIGQQLAQFVMKKFGLRKTYFGAQFMRAATIGGMIFLLGIGHMPLSLMFVFYAANGLVSGIMSTADGTMRKLVVGTGDGRQEKFRSTYQLLAEVIGFTAPILFGSLVAVVGPSWITAIYPATIVVALLLLLARKVIPADAMAKMTEADAKSAAADAGRAKTGLGAKLKSVWGTMAEGFRIVWNTPVLRYSFLIAGLFDLQNVFLYRLFAPGLGKLVAGSAGMAPVQGMVAGLYSLGGMLAAMIILAMAKKSAAARKDMPKDQSAEADRRSMLKWALWGVPALLGLASMALPLPALGAMVHLPAFLSWAGAMTVPALAMIPFGIIQVAASIKTNSFFMDQLPEDKDKVQKALAFQGSAMTFLSILGLIAMKPLFKDISAAHNPFYWIAIGLIPFGAVILFLQRRLSSASRPAAPPAAK